MLSSSYIILSFYCIFICSCTTAAALSLSLSNIDVARHRRHRQVLQPHLLPLQVLQPKIIETTTTTTTSLFGSKSYQHSHLHLHNQAQEETQEKGQVQVQEQQQQPSIKDFERDVTKVLNTLTVDGDPTIYPRIFAASPLTITRIWDLDLWTRSTSRVRYIRFLGNMFCSRLFKRILPQLLAFITWSIICVSIIHPGPTSNALNVPHVPLASLSLVSTFIAFLITLRTNQSLGRLGEARNLWGRLFITSRDTAQLLSTYVYEKDKVLGLMAVRYLSLFSWTVKDRLRDSDRMDIIETMIPSGGSNVHVVTSTNGDGNGNEIENDSGNDNDNASKYSYGGDLAYLSSQRKRPAAIIARIRQLVAVLAQRNMIPYAPHQQLEQNLNEMNYILGMCERLKGSPIPPVYTSHTSRLLVFYLVFLPLALLGGSSSAQTKLTTVLLTATVSYAMLGLDEISHVLEQPFRLMPLHDLSRNIMMDVADALVCRPPPFGQDVNEDENENEDGGQLDLTAPMYWS